MPVRNPLIGWLKDRLCTQFLAPNSNSCGPRNQLLSFVLMSGLVVYVVLGLKAQLKVQFYKICITDLLLLLLLSSNLKETLVLSLCTSVIFRVRSEFEMTESSSRIGLKWEPNLPSFGFSGTKTTTASSHKLEISSNNTLSKPELVDGLFVPPNDPKKLNKLAKKQLKDTAGKSWFDMPAPTITPEIKKDLQLLKLRTVLDPKRHYKKGDMKSKALPKYFQVGTVIESASDFFSGRLTKKERKATLAEELLSDQHLGSYRKRKVQEIEKQYNVGGVEKWKIKGRQSYRRAKQRRN